MNIRLDQKILFSIFPLSYKNLIFYSYRDKIIKNSGNYNEVEIEVEGSKILVSRLVLL